MSHHRERLYKRVKRAADMRTLTDRNQRVVECFLAGATEVEIGAALGLTRGRVNRILNDVARIAEKRLQKHPSQWPPTERDAARAQQIGLLKECGVKNATEVVKALWSADWTLTWIPK